MNFSEINGPVINVIYAPIVNSHARFRKIGKSQKGRERSIFKYVHNFGELFICNPQGSGLFQRSLFLTDDVCFCREHDFGNFTYHFKMGPQKFGNPDTNSGETFGATCYTGKGCFEALCYMCIFLL